MKSEDNMEKMIGNYKENRPWGYFENILDEPMMKVKKIVINPGESPSYQYHDRRDETWVIVSGMGELRLHGKYDVMSSHLLKEKIDCENEVVLGASEGISFFIPRGTKHQIKNIGSEPLVFIEVQTGDYFGEDDIVRLEDKYGRT